MTEPKNSDPDVLEVISGAIQELDCTVSDRLGEILDCLRPIVDSIRPQSIPGSNGKSVSLVSAVGECAYQLESVTSSLRRIAAALEKLANGDDGS